jgi:hypothetical protein
MYIAIHEIKWDIFDGSIPFLVIKISINKIW